MTKQEDKVVATTKRIDMHTSTVHNGLLELQRAIQQGYVIDFSKTPARARASRIIITLVGANSDVKTVEVAEEAVVKSTEVIEDVKEAPKKEITQREAVQKAPRKKSVEVKTDEKE